MAASRRDRFVQALKAEGVDATTHYEPLHLSPFARKRFSDLSGGQKQRVLLARALAAEPEILVLDEPLAGIDITTQHALLKLLKELKEKRRLTILMVSHRVSAEKALFTNIAWVDEGRVTTGSATEMLSKGRLSEIFKSEL